MHIQINAKKYALLLKKIKLQPKLKTRLTAYVKRAFSFFVWSVALTLVLYIIPELTPIRMYNIVQAIGKRNDGGDSGGVFISL